MPVMHDSEIQAMYSAELAERSARLADMAQLARSGTATDDDLETLRREAHTIKGTSRMMGYTAIGDAGYAVEQAVPRAAADPGVALAIEGVAAVMTGSIEADPDTGSPQLAAAVMRLADALEGKAPEPEPHPEHGEQPLEPFPIAAPGVPEGLIPGTDSHDLGGLLSNLDSWAFGETVRVDTSGLFRLINAICSLRIDTEVLETLVLATDGGTVAPEIMARLRAEVVRAGRDAGEVQRQAIDLASAPIAEITSTFSQLLRYLGRKTNKELRFELVGDELRADRQVLERLADPLRQLLVNAVHHGLESPEERQAAGKPRTGRVSLRARIKENTLEFTVEDDGRGVDWPAVHRLGVERGLIPARSPAEPDRLRSILFSDGFGTGSSTDLISGDGSGLAAMAEAVESLHGTFTFETTPGKGTTVVLSVPLSRALQDAVLIRAAGQQWGIPEIAVLGTTSLAAVGADGGLPGEVEWQGVTVPVHSFAGLAGLSGPGTPTSLLVVSSPGGPVGLAVDGVIGARQIAVRELGPLLSSVPHLTGAALLGGGDFVVLVDPVRLVARAGEAQGDGGTGDETRTRVLVVDDSLGVRQVVGSALGSAGFAVALAASADEALAHLDDHEVDAIVLDYVLPEMDGATLARTIRSLGIDAPIVVLSGLATPRDQALALQAGADLYFDKDDVRKGALAEALHRLVKAHAVA
ncbi:MAG: response regulator [Actinobacteria bacterium]|nr:response regulator [Actinomycetota bacterium]